MRLFVILISIGLFTLSPSPASPARDGSPPDLTVDWLDKGTRRISVKIDRDSISRNDDFAVIGSDRGVVAYIYPYEILADRIWSQSLRERIFENVAIGMVVVPARLTTGRAISLREEGLVRTTFHDTLLRISKLEDEVWDLELEEVEVRELYNRRAAFLTEKEQKLLRDVRKSWSDECTGWYELARSVRDRCELLEAACQDEKILGGWGQDEVKEFMDRSSCYPDTVNGPVAFPDPQRMDRSCCLSEAYQAVSADWLEAERDREEAVRRYSRRISRNWGEEDREALEDANRDVEDRLEDIEDLVSGRRRDLERIQDTRAEREDLKKDREDDLGRLAADRAQRLKDMDIYEAELARLRERLQGF